MLDFKKPTLIIDTREQDPLSFVDYADAFQYVIRGTVGEGDYTTFMPGDKRKIAFERKSLPDLVGTLIKGKERFAKELERLLSYEYKAIIVESTYAAVAANYSFSQVPPALVLSRLQVIQLNYGVDVIFSGSRSNSAEIIATKVEAFYAQARR